MQGTSTQNGIVVFRRVSEIAISDCGYTTPPTVATLHRLVSYTFTSYLDETFSEHLEWRPIFEYFLYIYKNI